MIPEMPSTSGNIDLRAALSLESGNQSVKDELRIVQGLKEAQSQAKVSAVLTFHPWAWSDFNTIAETTS